LKKWEKRADAWCAGDKVEMEIQKLKIESPCLEARFLERIFKNYFIIKITNITILMLDGIGNLKMLSVFKGRIWVVGNNAIVYKNTEKIMIKKCLREKFDAITDTR
jgi:hypothetical protein